MQNSAPASSGKRIMRKYDGKKLQWLHAARNFAILLVIVFLIFNFLIGISKVSGPSMNDTFKSGEFVFYTRVFHELERGDIVSVKIPDGTYWIKRVIAVGGDVVDLKDGVIYINGEPETGDYFKGETQPESTAVMFPYTVEPDNVFVLGDNRPESYDSRWFGARRTQDVKGLVHASFGFFFIRLF